jgi:class 3 adenylate cyclase
VAPKRRLAANLLTDMAVSRAAVQGDEAETLRLRDEPVSLVRPLFAVHLGREIRAIGDGSLVVFDRA